MSALLDFRDAERPPDDSPVGDIPPDPDYPDATPEAPYGYTAGGRIRKRPIGSRSNSSGGPTGANSRNESLGASAAQLLAQMNSLVGLSLSAFKLVETSDAIDEANKIFEPMAREALANDPKLARRIMSGGVSSSKAQLTLAYVVFGMAIMPSAREELSERRAAMKAAREAEYDESIPGA